MAIEADPFINRVSAIIGGVTDEALKLRFKVVITRKENN